VTNKEEQSARFKAEARATELEARLLELEQLLQAKEKLSHCRLED